MKASLCGFVYWVRPGKQSFKMFVSRRAVPSGQDKNIWVRRVPLMVLVYEVGGCRV